MRHRIDMGKKLGQLLLVLVIAGATFFGLHTIMENKKLTAQRDIESKAASNQAPVPETPDEKPADSTTPDKTPTEPDLSSISSAPLPTKTTPRTRTKKPKKISRVKTVDSRPEPAKLKAVLTVRDTTPPKLRILRPSNHTYIMKPSISIQVQSEAGGKVSASRKSLKEVAGGLFDGKMKLARGLNKIEIKACDPVGNCTRSNLNVTFVDPARVKRSKKRFSKLLKKLEDVRALATDVDHQTAELINQIDATTDAHIITKLSKELRAIRKSRRELQREIGQAIYVIDEMLRANR